MTHSDDCQCEDCQEYREFTAIVNSADQRGYYVSQSTQIRLTELKQKVKS